MSEWNELFKSIEVNEPENSFVEFAGRYLSAGMRVLDIGCGTGRHSFYLASRFVDTYAMDISEFALTTLKNGARKRNLSIKTQKSSFLELPYEDEYFDAVISIHVHNHGLCKEIKEAFTEMNRVICKGGYLFLIVAPDSVLPQFILPASRLIEPGTYIDLDLYDGDIPHHFFSEAEIVDCFKDFDCISIAKYNEGSMWTAKGIIEKLLYMGRKI